MAKQSGAQARAAPSAVTAERARRLHRMLNLLVAGPRSREQLRRQLKLDVRSFYRDLELLRQAGIAVGLVNRLYALDMAPATAFALLPFPDPHLSLGDALQLAKGRSTAHRKLKAMVDEIVGTTAKAKKKLAAASTKRAPRLRRGPAKHG